MAQAVSVAPIIHHGENFGITNKTALYAAAWFAPNGLRDRWRRLGLFSGLCSITDGRVLALQFLDEPRHPAAHLSLQLLDSLIR